MVPYRIVHEVYDSETVHGSSLYDVQQPAANGIFAHLLYVPVQFPKFGPEQLT